MTLTRIFWPVSWLASFWMSCLPPILRKTSLLNVVLPRPVPWDVVLVGAIKGSLWAEYTSQAGSVTDGIPGCRTGQSGLPDSDSRLGANRFSVRTKKASCSRWSSGRTGLAAASLTGKSLQNVCVAGVPLRPRPYMHGPIF